MGVAADHTYWMSTLAKCSTSVSDFVDPASDAGAPVPSLIILVRVFILFLLFSFC